METSANKLRAALLSFGLSEKESDVYLALLELGRSKVSEIARKAGMNRTTAYDILDSLTSKGLASISGKEPKQEYEGETPDNLIVLLEKRLEKTKDAIREAEEIIPALKSIQKVSDRPQVKFYEGLNGIKQ